VAALGVGFATVLALETFAGQALATPWQMTIATTLSVATCCLGSRRSQRDSYEFPP
jgi:hypothetical protein